MKKRSAKDVVTRVLIGLMIVFSVTVLARIVVQNFVVETLHINNQITSFLVSGKAEDSEESATSTVEIDWPALYPFVESEEDISAEKTDTKENQKSLPEKLMAPIQESVESFTTSKLVGYDAMVEAERTYEAKVSWELEAIEEYNSIQTLEDGYLVTYMTAMDMTPNIKAVSDFSDFCQSKGIDFLYVQAPGKLSKYEDTEICGTMDFSNQRGDDLVNGLLNNGVNVLDLRDSIQEDGLSYRSLFFKTDHHWKPETGLWATGKIAEHLNQLFVLDLDLSVLDASRYTEKVYEDWMLGSKGKKLTLAKAEPEDISLFYPNFDTELSMQIPSLGLDETGDFSITYNMEQIEEKDYEGKKPYGVYCYGDKPLIQIQNKQGTSGTKLLVLRTSYAGVVTPFLALAADKVDILDLRHFTGSVQSYIQESQPDAVVVLYNLGSLGEVETENHDNIFDFR